MADKWSSVSATVPRKETDPLTEEINHELNRAKPQPRMRRRHKTSIQSIFVLTILALVCIAAIVSVVCITQNGAGRMADRASPS